jgi:hypothetical protein
MVKIAKGNKEAEEAIQRGEAGRVQGEIGDIICEEARERIMMEKGECLHEIQMIRWVEETVRNIKNESE